MNHIWYVFRHALATHSTTGYGDQILSAEILDEGIASIKKMSKFLNGINLSANYTSEIVRCRQTVEIISGITKKIFTPDTRLNEYNEEQFSHLSQRIETFITEASQVTVSNILVCTHGSVLAGLKHLLTDGTFIESDVYDYPSCGELIIISDNTYVKKNFND